ncbi:hypothetical protein M493_16085 [Geobacillus genomosp. 3]|uniref:Uncharacterized protein n=1 Tax=Geobacillus genomosp. 3 TaxID=1921421 RepID=S6A3V3_GEOG3|nr:hypothetical protein M493_16085 [Geobacillus genomosp. 3]
MGRPNLTDDRSGKGAAPLPLLFAQERGECRCIDANGGRLERSIFHAFAVLRRLGRMGWLSGQLAARRRFEPSPPMNRFPKEVFHFKGRSSKKVGDQLLKRKGVTREAPASKIR